MLRRGSSLTLALLLPFVASCDFQQALDTADRFEPVILVPPQHVRVTGTFLDAMTGRPMALPVTLGFAGEGGSLVRDALGHRVESLVAPRGAVTFGLSNTINPQPGRPVELRVLAHAPGYQESAVRLVVSESGWQEFRVLMQPQGGLLSPSTTDKWDLDLAGGLTPDALLEIFDLGTSLVRVSIPAGLRPQDEGGLALADRVSATVSMAPPSRSLMATLPGGVDAGVRTAGGAVESASLTTGGVFRFDLAGTDGRYASRLGGTVGVTVLLDPSLLNPHSNEAIRAGDPIEVYHWEPDDGLWTTQTETTVSSRESHLTAEFEIDRPGFFSLGYRSVHCAPARLALAENRSGGSLVAYRGSPTDADGVRVWRFPAGVTEVNLHSPPDFWRGVVEVRRGDTAAQIPYDGLCGRTFTVGSVEESAQELAFTLSAQGCAALRVDALPTLVALVTPQSATSDPFTRWIEASYLPHTLQAETDDVGRLASVRVSAAGRTRDVDVVLGTFVQSFEDVQNGSSLDITPMARDAGLCVSN